VARDALQLARAAAGFDRPSCDHGAPCQEERRKVADVVSVQIADERHFSDILPPPDAR